jgi:hypothetical protein
VEDPNPVPVRHLWILDWLESRRSVTGSEPIEGPIRRLERGSEWELIKILLQRENSAYAPNSKPRIPTRVCQGSIVTADLPTLEANSKRSQSKSETQRAKDLAAQHWNRRTVRKHQRTVREAWADSPQTPGGPSVWPRRTVREATTDRPKTTPEPLVLHPQ